MSEKIEMVMAVRSEWEKLKQEYPLQSKLLIEVDWIDTFFEVIDEQQAKNNQYEEALNQIIAYGPLGGIETAAAAGQAFQLIAKEALEGES